MLIPHPSASYSEAIPPSLSLVQGLRESIVFFDTIGLGLTGQPPWIGGTRLLHDGCAGQLKAAGVIVLLSAFPEGQVSGPFFCGWC
jgi:hypothetical protein